MGKFTSELVGLIWTLAGTLLVLITLSGSTRTIGIWISVVALVLNLIGILFNNDD